MNILNYLQWKLMTLIPFPQGQVNRGIVFDASTRYDIALNVIFQGPKLQNNLFDTLRHFW